MSSSTPLTNIPLPQNIASELYSGTRLTSTTKTPYATILSRFHSLVPSISLASLLNNPDRATFESTVSSQIGPHGFALFFKIDHTNWIQFYPDDSSAKGPNHGRALTRFVFGNPLIAITMIRQDVEAGLHAPIEMLLMETEDGGAKCVAQLPSGLIAGHEGGKGNDGLVKAVAELDRKLLGLIEELMK
jgi:uncharacterized protein (DUF302 family)